MGFWRTLLSVQLVALLWTFDARAHDPFEITTDARLGEGHLKVRITMARSTALKACLGKDVAQALRSADFETQRPQLEGCAPELYVITDAGTALRPGDVQVLLTEENDVEATLLYPLPAMGPLRFDAVHLKRLPDPTYGATLTVSAERVLFGQQLLRATESTLEVDIARGPPSSRRAPVLPSFWQYVRLGIEHILTGYDHLLFLAGLLLVCRRFRSVLAIATSFTAAHSLTLALSAIGVFALPSKVAEPLIAATIVFVGVENLVRGDEPRWRWLLAFCFGLIHGFGFASALSATGIGLSGVPLAMPLFSFNLGVEIGQVAVVAAFLPALGGLSRFPNFARYGRPLLSCVVAAIGVFWLIERVAVT